MNRKKYKYDFNCTINQSTQPQQVSIVLREDELLNQGDNIKNFIANRIKEILVEKNGVKKGDKISFVSTGFSQIETTKSIVEEIINKKTIRLGGMRRSTRTNLSSNVIH